MAKTVRRSGVDYSVHQCGTCWFCVLQVMDYESVDPLRFFVIMATTDFRAEEIPSSTQNN